MTFNVEVPFKLGENDPINVPLLDMGLNSSTSIRKGASGVLANKGQPLTYVPTF